MSHPESFQLGCRRAAFTLVELLVVIGIIALLISALLPALSRARQSANLIDCQARLRQMGQALQIYQAQYKGFLPYSDVKRDRTFAPWIDPATDYRNTPSNREPDWFWMFTLSEIMNKNLLDPNDGLVHNLSPVFRDKDTIEGTGSPRYVNHYTANPRVMYRSDVPDLAPLYLGSANQINGSDLKSRKATSVKHSTEVFVIWDAPQTQQTNYNAYEIAESIDAWGWYNGGALCWDPLAAGLIVNRAILPGQLGVTGRQPGQQFQIKYNLDPQFAFGGSGWLSHLRFRHMNNKKLAALCLDGHTETRDVGTVMVRDIYTNYR